jgi:hypothetical protein
MSDSPREFLAVWHWKLADGRRQEVTMTFWAPNIQRATHIADVWFEQAMPEIVDPVFSVADLANERIPM